MMTNFDKLVFSQNWVKICKETTHDFTESKVVVLGYKKDGLRIMAFDNYTVDSSDLMALRGRDIAIYYMELSVFESLFESIFKYSFSLTCEPLTFGQGGKMGEIKDGIGIRKIPFLSIEIFEVKDALDLTALGKLEGMLWR